MIKKAKITVLLKEQILDPQGKAVLKGLQSLGFGEVTDVRQGKVFYLHLESPKSRSELEEELRKMTHKLLANPIMENFKIEFLE